MKRNDVTLTSRDAAPLKIRNPIQPLPFIRGEASLYAKPNDAVDMAEKILELLDNPAKRDQMGAFGRTRVENELAWPYEAPNLLAVYARATNSG